MLVSYSLANRGPRSDFHDEESFSDRDSYLTGEALGDLRVAHRKRSYPLLKVPNLQTNS